MQTVNATDSAMIDRVRVRDLPHGFQIVLPKRDLGPVRWIGGLVLFLTGAFFIVPRIEKVVSAAGNQWDTFDYLFAIIPGCMMAVTMVMGFSALNGRSEIRVTRDRIKAIERMGLFRWTRSRDRSALTGLEILHTGKTNQDKSDDHTTPQLPSRLGRWSQMAGVKATFKAGVPMTMIMGYPLSLVRHVTDDLADRLDTRPARLTGHDDPAAFRVTERSIANVVESAVHKILDDRVDHAEEVPPQPERSRVILEAIEGGISLNVPPAGIWKGSKGLIFMGIFWLGLTSAITFAMMSDSSVPWFVYLVMGVFWAIGIGIVVSAVHMGKRRAIIDVIGDALLVTETGIFGTKQHEWTADQIAGIYMGPSGMEVNNKTVMQLQIKPKSTDKYGIFTGREEDELQWLAATLRHAIGLTTPRNTRTTPDDPDTPPPDTHDAADPIDG